jgi:hypothetical protein
MTPDGLTFPHLTRPQSENALQPVEALERERNFRADDGGVGYETR